MRWCALMAVMDTPHDRLEQAMDARRMELRLTWQDVAQAANVSPAALRAIRRGTYQPRELTKRKIEDALYWTHGSIDAIMAGGEPETTLTVKSFKELLKDPEELRGRFPSVAETIFGKSPEDRQAADIAQLRDEIRAFLQHVDERLEEIDERQRGAGA